MKVAVRSTLPYQVPAFVAEENPLFMEFLDAYYEWLEQDGMPLDYIRNALNFLDVDQTLDRFINHFWEEVKDIPLEAKANRRLLAKHVYDLYQSKGTIKSFKLLFRILYNEDMEIYTPKDDMLRVSDGKWQVNQIIRSRAVDGDPFGLIGLTLRQINPDASVLVQNVIEVSYGAEKFYDIYIEPGTVIGTLRHSEEAFANWTDENGDNQTITVNLPIAPTGVQIRSKGRYYEAGTPIKLLDSTGTEFESRVGEIGVGAITGVMILDGGSGYVVGDELEVQTGTSGGIGLRVVVAAVEGGVVTKVDIANPGQAYSSLPAISGPKGGKFLAYSSNVGRVLEISTSSVGRNHEDQNVETTILTHGVITDPIGNFIAGESLTLLGDAVLTENYDAFLTEEGDRIVNETVNTQPTPAKVNSVIGNMIELEGQVSRRAVALDGASGFFLAEDGSIVINEISSADLNRRTIVGATSGATCRILDLDAADVMFTPGVLALTGSSFASLDGKISEYTKRIQDSKFYQDFSYVIKSAQSIDTYKNVVHKLIHPAGFAMFGQIHAETHLKVGLRLIQSFESLVDIQTFINMGFHIEETHYKIVMQSPVYETYEALDGWKFPSAASAADPIYQSDTPISHFGDLKFTDVYEYDGAGVATGYKRAKYSYNRGSEIRVNGILI